MKTQPAKPSSKKQSERTWILPQAPRLGDFAVYGNLSDKDLNELCESCYRSA